VLTETPANSLTGVWCRAIRNKSVLLLCFINSDILYNTRYVTRLDSQSTTVPSINSRSLDTHKRQDVAVHPRRAHVANPTYYPTSCLVVTGSFELVRGWAGGMADLGPTQTFLRWQRSSKMPAAQGGWTHVQTVAAVAALLLQRLHQWAFNDSAVSATATAIIAPCIRREDLIEKNRLHMLQLLLPRPWQIGGRGYCFRSISLFVCMYVYMYLSFFLSLLARLREKGWTDLHEIFREGVEWPWDDVVQFWANSEKSRDAAMCNTGTGFVVLSHRSLLRKCRPTVSKNLITTSQFWNSTIIKQPFVQMCIMPSVSFIWICEPYYKKNPPVGGLHSLYKIQNASIIYFK